MTYTTQPIACALLPEIEDGAADVTGSGLPDTCPVCNADTSAVVTGVVRSYECGSSYVQVDHGDKWEPASPCPRPPGWVLYEGLHKKLSEIHGRENAKRILKGEPPTPKTLTAFICDVLGSAIQAAEKKRNNEAADTFASHGHRLFEPEVEDDPCFNACQEVLMAMQMLTVQPRDQVKPIGPMSSPPPEKDPVREKLKVEELAKVAELGPEGGAAPINVQRIVDDADDKKND